MQSSRLHSVARNRASAQPGTERTIRVLDVGHENVAVGIIAKQGGKGAKGG